MAIPRGIRNFNPGNLRKGPEPWHGEIPGPDPSFCTFDSPENGIRALAVLLRGYQHNHGLDTVMKIISRYAPASENNSFSYAQDVAEQMGVGVTDTINLDAPGTLMGLVLAIIRHENGRNYYTMATISDGVNSASESA